MADPTGEIVDGTAALSTCVLCPRLCRPACPVSIGSAREAAVPAVIAAAIREWRAGRLPPEVAAQAATLCTDCGACQSHCHLDRPLPAILRAARVALADVLGGGQPEELRAIEGTGDWLVIEADDRPFAAAFARVTAATVARLRTFDRLGSAALERMANREAFLHRIRALLGSRRVVVADGGTAAGVLTRTDLLEFLAHSR